MLTVSLEMNSNPMSSDLLTIMLAGERLECSLVEEVDGPCGIGDVCKECSAKASRATIGMRCDTAFSIDFIEALTRRG